MLLNKSDRAELTLSENLTESFAVFYSFWPRNERMPEEAGSSAGRALHPGLFPGAPLLDEVGNGAALASRTQDLGMPRAGVIHLLPMPAPHFDTLPPKG